MLTEEDVVRMDQLMAGVREARRLRGFIPERDEEKIISILNNRKDWF